MMISRREFVILLPSSFRRIYWHTVQGVVVIHPYRWLRCNPRGEGNLMTILPLRKSGIWRMPSTPAGGHVHDYHRIERGCGGGGSPPNWCSVTLASTFLWRCDSMHAFRGPIRMCVFKLISQWLYPSGKRPRFPLKSMGGPSYEVRTPAEAENSHILPRVGSQNKDNTFGNQGVTTQYWSQLDT
jgi:hypothetical protein